MTKNDAATSAANTESKTKAREHKTKTKAKRQRKFVGFSEQLEMKRREREDKPRTWIERKLVVPFVFGIVGYAWYVYIGRFCVPMIRRDEKAFGGRGMGVAFLIVFCLLGIMFWWSYIKLLFTPPGFATDYVQKTPPPPSTDPLAPGRRTTPSASRAPRYGFDDVASDLEDDFIGGTPYTEISPSSTNEGPSARHQQSVDVEKHTELNVPAAPHRPPASGSQAGSPPRRKHSDSRPPVQVSDTHRTHGLPRHSSGGRNTDETAVERAGGEDTMGKRGGAPPVPLTKQVAPALTNVNETQHLRTDRSAEEGLPPPMYSRRPPTYPSLLPEYRYCPRDGLVKPMRAHHCKICGTCVLMYDHHCPWIGHCVGARNHKFFVIFLQWSTPWTLWIFATLVGLQAKNGSKPNADIDPQIIVIIALSAFFSLFTGILLAAHIRMIMLNQTSVESLLMSGMRDRERAILGRMVPLCDWQRRNALRKEWDEEWGKIGTEGNIWWLGGARENWKYRMGRNVWGWFLPIGKSEGDGLTYPRNPRFDADGRWRRRREWPSELR